MADSPFSGPYSQSLKRIFCLFHGFVFFKPNRASGFLQLPQPKLRETLRAQEPRSVRTDCSRTKASRARHGRKSSQKKRETNHHTQHRLDLVPSGHEQNCWSPFQSNLETETQAREWVSDLSLGLWTKSLSLFFFCTYGFPIKRRAVMKSNTVAYWQHRFEMRPTFCLLSAERLHPSLH